MPVETRPIDSLKKRYLVTLFSNIVTFFASLVTAGVVPRALGPEQLGNFSFLSRVSAAFRNVLNMETSTAFFTLASKQDKSGPLVKVYSIWFITQLFLILLIVIFAFALGLGRLIWPGQDFKYIFWIAILDWMIFLGVTLKAIGDAKGFTVKAQLINLLLSILNIGILVIFAMKGWLNLSIYIAIQMIASASLSLLLITYIILPNKGLYWLGTLKNRVSEFITYFYHYCLPLFIFIFVSFIFEYLERIILQKFSGSTQQGYYHIASSWSAFSAIFTASFLSIYKREIAYSLGKENKIYAAEIFSKFLKILYFLTLTLGVYLSFHAQTLVSLLAGQKFKAAGLPLAIMAFYPAHQVYGQLCGATFLSSERTGLWRNLAVILGGIGIIFTYFFIATPNAIVPGLGLGASGLALKTVLYNLIAVQVYLWYNCSFLKLDIRNFWRHQIHTFLLLVTYMFIVRTFSKFLLISLGYPSDICSLILDTLVYFSGIGLLLFLYPEIIGLKRQDINLLSSQLLLWLKGGNSIRKEHVAN